MPIPACAMVCEMRKWLIDVHTKAGVSLLTSRKASHLKIAEYAYSKDNNKVENQARCTRQSEAPTLKENQAKQQLMTGVLKA